MEAKELRIGNWVRFLATQKQLLGISKKNYNMGTETTLHYAEFKDYIPVMISHLRPIPLTEEWHNKFGSKKNGFNSFEYSLKNKLNLSIIVVFNGDYVMLRQGYGDMDDDVVSIWNKDKTRRDMYVHEWQNLFYALSGEELTFND